MHSSIELIDIDLMQLWLFEIQKAQPRSDQVTEHFGDNVSGKTSPESVVLSNASGTGEV
jgi:hypothetical protein